MTESNDAYEALMQFLYQAPIGLVQSAADGRIEMLNPMSSRLLMPLSADGGLENLYGVLDGIAPQLRVQAQALDADVGVVCESLRVRLPARDGAQEQALAISMLKLDAQRYMTVLLDVTAALQREEADLARQVRTATQTDALTHMPNRAAVRDRLQEAIDRAARDPRAGFALLYLNVDRFGRINDTHGPAIGDEVLQLMAQRLRSALRAGDQVDPAAALDPLAARMSGDEFVVLLDDPDHTVDAAAVAQRLITALAAPCLIDDHTLHVGVSMGVVQRAEGGADTVLQAASIAMFEAKRAGGGRFVVFEPQMQSRAAQRGALEEDLRHAIVAGELHVVYQPVIALGHGLRHPRAAGVEALVRWRHPDRGNVPPLDFIGVAEDCGLIDAIGAYVLETACRQFVAWQRDLGPQAPRTMAVNLSRKQLSAAGFVASVARTLADAGMDPACLQLEVTESLAAQDDSIQRRLHELKSLGLTLALDDFGTGYSSLASLHLLPVDTVKIDRSFVSLAASSPHHRVLIEATVRVANSLGMNTVAEGIETDDQAAIVSDLGCDKGQGYLYSRPLEAAAIGPWLAQSVAMH